MKSITRLRLILLLLFSTVIYSYGQRLEKKVPNFKDIIHNIDTLDILPPYVDIKVVYSENKISQDSAYSLKLSDTLTYMISKLLNKKYHLHRLPKENRVSRKFLKDINPLLYKLDNTNSVLPDIELEDSIVKMDNSKSRYSLITVFNGYYVSLEKRNKDALEMLPQSILVGVLSLGTLTVVPNEQSLFTGKFILYDNVKKRVLFYKTDFRPDLHNVGFYMYNQIVMDNLKGLYYK